MKKLYLFFIAVLFVGMMSISASATDPEISSRQVNIWSDGTRLSGDIWYPATPNENKKRPAIILCHGWGGVRSHLNQAYAPDFAKAGYVVLTFDYRGWGDSDSRLVFAEKMPAPDNEGMVTIKAKAIRELVDPFDQTEDIINCINFISGEPMVDANRIGLWGTSYGGGHVLYVATHDERIKCIFSQVPSMDSKIMFAGDPIRLGYIRERDIQRARGEIDPVPQNVNKVQGLDGTPYLCRMANYSPVEFADRLKVPVLILVAEKEALMDNTLHGQRVYDIVKKNVPSEYVIFPGTHFEVYNKGRSFSIQHALEWFGKHL